VGFHFKGSKELTFLSDTLGREGSNVGSARSILALLLCAAALSLASCASGEQVSTPSPKPSKDEPTKQKEISRPQESTEKAAPQKKEPAPAPPPSEPEPEEEDPEQSSFEATTTVTRVVDGDTLDISPALEGMTRVRLIGVDTPETSDPDCGKQPYADEAKTFTTSRLQRQQVGLEFDVEKTDRYGRLLAYVYPSGEEMFNETLLREGYAQVATFPPNVKYVDRFLAAQQGARSIGAGLWGLSPEALAAQTDRGNGIGGRGCLRKEAAQPKAQPKQAPAAPAGGDVDCSDFSSWEEAQSYLLPGDPHRLDRDGDGSACDNLKGRGRGKKVR
jgi:micrococcal nuclease